jgi:hypothetical protein
VNYVCLLFVKQSFVSNIELAKFRSSQAFGQNLGELRHSSCLRDVFVLLRHLDKILESCGQVTTLVRSVDTTCCIFFVGWLMVHSVC